MISSSLVRRRSSIILCCSANFAINFFLSAIRCLTIIAGSLTRGCTCSLFLYLSPTVCSLYLVDTVTNLKLFIFDDVGTMVKNSDDGIGITSSAKDFVEKHPENLSFVLLQVRVVREILVKTKLGVSFDMKK